MFFRKAQHLGVSESLRISCHLWLLCIAAGSLVEPVVLCSAEFFNDWHGNIWQHMATMLLHRWLHQHISTSTYLFNHVIMLNEPDYLLASTCFSGTRGLVGGHMWKHLRSLARRLSCDFQTLEGGYERRFHGFSLGDAPHQSWYILCKPWNDVECTQSPRQNAASATGPGSWIHSNWSYSGVFLFWTMGNILGMCMSIA